MSKIAVFTRNFILPLAFLTLCYVKKADAQAPNKVDKFTDGVNSFTRLFNSLAELQAALHRLNFETARTTADFNKNVTVSKGNDAAKVQTMKKGDIHQPVIKADTFANLKWEPVTYFNNELYPSSIICMASYTDPKSLQGQLEAISRPIGFKILSPLPNVPVRWEIECADKKYFDKVGGTVLYTDKDKETDVMPVIPWNYSSLAKQISSTPVSIYFRLFNDKGVKVEKLVNLSIKSINDCIYYYRDLPLDFLFAGFIQEQHPEITNIKRDAINTKMVADLNAYQGSTPANVDAQVAAVWRILHDRGINYNNNPINPSAGNKDIRTLEVHTFDNAIKTAQGNCLDGSIVFASILKSIGIHSALIIMPDHCLLGYWTDDSKSNIKYVETTMLAQGTYVDKKTGKSAQLAQAKTEDQKKAAYSSLLQAAEATGKKEYDGSLATNPTNPPVTIDVDETRKLVPNPIPLNTN